MRSHQRTILLTLAIVVAAALSRPAGQRPDARGPAERGWTHPRTPWGDPDLEGVWTTDDNFAIPLERPVEVADKVFLDGKEPGGGSRGTRQDHRCCGDRGRGGRRSSALGTKT